MRYIRFLKIPRIVTDKITSTSHVQCLATITSDLGDSFLPYDIQLSAELLACQTGEHVLVWRTVQWRRGLRSLLIELPLRKCHAHLQLRVRVGYEPKSISDEYGKLAVDGEPRGVVSAWSTEFNLLTEATRFVERRFQFSNALTISIWEETGESIARHLWDAGIALSCHLPGLLDKDSELSHTLLPSKNMSALRVLELGTGCGMVGISIMKLWARAEVILTDLPEAREIVERNMAQVEGKEKSSITFLELDWDNELPPNLLSPAAPLDLILAADCTYNPDTSPSLVSTLVRLAITSPRVKIGVAMKMRHPSEEIFFDYMKKGGFHRVTTLAYPLPGDSDVGEEVVYFHVYEYKPKRH